MSAKSLFKYVGPLVDTRHERVNENSQMNELIVEKYLNNNKQYING